MNITAPKPFDPTVGSKIAVDKQPLTLIVENASTSGVRPLSYVFEVATDVNFTNKVFSRDSIAPGEDGRTSLRLPDPLATGRTYYWRARAQDGANAGDYSATANFNVFTPIVIDVPNLLTPAANATVDTLRPRFTVGNAPRSGPVGPITYQIEVADSDSFANKIASWTAGEQANQTTLDLPVDLAYSHVYYWHARAADPTTAGPWSRTLAFATAAAPVVTTPSPGPGPTPSGPVAADAFNLGSATVYQSPSGVASWPVTTSLSSIAFGSDGVRVNFDRKTGANRWPDVTPPGWSGTLQYTLWIAMNTNGQWATTGPIEYWYGLEASGGDVTRGNQIPLNWTYDCGPMTRQPAPGEMVGFFVTAGDARRKDVAASHERSNVVLLPFPSGSQSFSFALGRAPGLR